jgi:pyrophosphatase PpaX
MTVYRRHYKAAHNDLLKPFDGISELLQRLNGAGVRIGVVSSKKSDYLQLGLQALGLDRWVRLLIGADETELHKPAHGKLVVTASQDHSLKVWDLRRRQLIDLIAPARRTHRRA